VDPIAGEYERLRGVRKVNDASADLSPASIVLKDTFQIDGSNIILWLTADVPTYGSLIEVGYSWAKGKAIVAIDAAGRGRQSAFVQHVCTYIADDLEQALTFIATHMVKPTPPPIPEVA